MITYRNPFEYEAASKFSDDEILDYYIPDFNYSRLLNSKRNIFLVGERGTGKTMTLLYSSYPVQMKKAVKEGFDLDLSLIGVYIPCNTPLNLKPEYRLLDNFQGSVVSEHFLVLTIMDRT